MYRSGGTAWAMSARRRAWRLVGRHGVGYVGTQAGMVYIITLVQGASPPESIMPGIERFAGIVGGLAILLIVSLLIWPTDEERADAS